MLSAGGRSPLYGIERVLEEADHQHALVAGQDVLGAVAVVHVEVDDGHALAGRGARAHSAPRSATLLKKQKPIALVAAGMVAGRAHGAEGVLQFAGHHRVGGGERRAGGAQRGVPACGRSSRCRDRSARRSRPPAAICSASSSAQAAQRGHVHRGRARVRVRSTVASGASRRSSASPTPRGEQAVLDGIEALRTFGVAASHRRAAGKSGWVKYPVLFALHRSAWTEIRITSRLMEAQQKLKALLDQLNTVIVGKAGPGARLRGLPAGRRPPADRGRARASARPPWRMRWRAPSACSSRACSSPPT